MATTYAELKRDLLNLLNALDGGTHAEKSMSYQAASPASVKTDWPDAAVNQAILDTEAEMIAFICSVKDHLRMKPFLSTLSGSLQSGAEVPDKNGANVPVVGPIHLVRDATDGRPLKLVKDPAELRWWGNAAGPQSSTLYANAPLYNYALDGSRIYHTRAAVIVDAPCFQKAAWAGAANIRIHDSFKRALLSGAAYQLLTKEGMFLAEAQEHRDFYESVVPGAKPAPA
jgi:hypothetical protein